MVQSALHRVSSARALQLFLTLYLTGALGGNSHGSSGGAFTSSSSSGSTHHSSHQSGGTGGLGFILPAASASSAGSSLCSASLINTCIPSLYALDLRGSPPDVSALFAMVALTELSFSSTTESTITDNKISPVLKAAPNRSAGLNGTYNESDGADLLALLTGSENARTTVRIEYLFEKEFKRDKGKKNRGGYILGF